MTDKEKSDFQEWKAKNGNPAMATKDTNICFLWQRTGSCHMGDKCRWSDSHTPENAPKDPQKGKGKGKKGKGKGKGKSKGKGKGKGKGKSKSK